MCLNRRAILLLAVTLCFLGGSYGVSSGSWSQSQGASLSIPTTLKAFTLYERELAFPREHTQPAEIDFTIARSSNGSRVREYTISPRSAPNGSKGIVRDIWDIPKRHYISVEPFTQSISTFLLSDDEISDLLQSAHACEGIHSLLASGKLPSRTMLGHKAYQVVRRRHNIVQSSWLAPDLNCFPLKKTEAFPNGAKNVTTVMKIVEGPPPDSMFTPPATYVERSPEQVESLYERLFGKELYPKQMVEHAESEYRKGR